MKAHRDKIFKKKVGTELGDLHNYPTMPNDRLGIFWRHQYVKVNMLYSDSQIVHCEVDEIGTSFSCNMTFAHGFNNIAKRKGIWQKLKILNTEPCIILGDFNIVVSVNDKINGLFVQPMEVAYFYGCIEDIGLGQFTRRGCQYC